MIVKGKKCFFYLAIIIHLFLFLTSGITQNGIDSSLVGRGITSIQIRGNAKTKPYIILREMKQQVGDELDLNLLELDRKRIQNLNLFNRVTIRAQGNDVQVQLFVLVEEKLYFFPYPILFIRERDWNKLSIGAGIRHLNFRGRAETINLRLWLGYNPAIQFSYSNPLIGGNRYFMTQVNFYCSQVRSKHFEEEINENHLGIEWILGKRFGYHTVSGIGLGYREITFSPPVYGQTLSSSGRDRLPSLNFFYTWDSRDLIKYPHEGFYISLFAKKTGLSDLSANYFFTGFDIRQYFPLISDWTIAIRAKTHFSGGEIPLYDRVYLGYSERVRGHYFEQFEGENMALASIAFRMFLIPVRYISLSNTSYLKNLKFGIGLGIFVDSGLTWFQGERIKRSMFHSGYGIGIHMHLPYIDIIRFELAFNEEGRSQLIVDLNVDI